MLFLKLEIQKEKELGVIAVQTDQSDKNGAPNKDQGVPNTYYGAPNKDQGAPNINFGASNKDLGSPNSNYGAPNEDLGAFKTIYEAPKEYQVASNTKYGAPADIEQDVLNTNYGAPNGEYSTQEAPNNEQQRIDPTIFGALEKLRESRYALLTF